MTEARVAELQVSTFPPISPGVVRLTYAQYRAKWIFGSDRASSREIPLDPRSCLPHEKFVRTADRSLFQLEPVLSSISSTPKKCPKATLRCFSHAGPVQDGIIDVLEFWEMCIALGKEIEVEAAAEALKKLDLNGDGVVDFEEFVVWYALQARGLGPAV